MIVMDFEQCESDLRDRGYDPHQLSILENKVNDAQIESESVLADEEKLREEYKKMHAQNDNLQKALKLGLGNPENLCVKTWCTKGPKFDEHIVDGGSFRQILNNLVFECRLFLGEMALDDYRALCRGCVSQGVRIYLRTLLA